MSTKKSKRFIFKNASTTYFYSSLFFPKVVWEKVATLYAYVRTADDFVDELPQDLNGFSNFIQETYHLFSLYKISTKLTGNWKYGAFFTSRLHEHTRYTYIIQPFVELCFSHKISVLWVTAFLRAMLRDVAQPDEWIRYSSRDELDEYVFGSAEVIGLMMCKILGIKKTAYVAAQKQGAAMQYINFIRDIAEDCTLQRIYFPTTVLKKYGVENVCMPPKSENQKISFSRFMHAEVTRFSKMQKDAEQGYLQIPYHYRVPIATAAALYMWTGTVIAKDPFIVYRKKIKPSKMRVAITLLSVALRELFRK